MNRNFKNSTGSITLFILISIFVNTIQAQNGAEIKLQLDKLNVLGSVLYIAAHPDDENTSLISNFVNERLLRTGYLSLTRGDGGQNLLGNEQGELLGVIRTQELLGARKIDFGEQFFTRAIDFGYSKTSEETLRNWDRELILYDIVKVIRKFQPDIIITRFSFQDGGHGHHLASTMLAVEAFNAAADPNRFPDQLKELTTWQAKRIVWNTWKPTDKSVSLEVGGFNTLLGKSYSEMAALGRSMHKSQGFGVSARRGSRVEAFEHLAGELAVNDLFESCDFSWKRVANSGKVQELITAITMKYEVNNPAASVPDLIKLYKELGKLENDNWVKFKKEKVKELIKACSGLWMESVVEQPGVGRGMEVKVNSTILNQSSVAVTLNRISTLYSLKDSLVNEPLKYNMPYSVELKSTIPLEADYSQPFWLEEESNGKMFAIPKPNLVGQAENGSAIKTKFNLLIDGEPFVFEIPVTYKFNDALKGEVQQPFVIHPEISLKIEEPNYIFAGGKSHDILVSVKALEKNQKGVLYVESPAGWKSEPKNFSFDLEDTGDNKTFAFKVTPESEAKNCELLLKAEVSGKKYTKNVVEISYDHIPKQIVLQEAKTNLIKLDINYEPKLIGYIMGSGDEIPSLLRQLGYTVDLLTDEDLDNKDLSIYSTIICGIRAFNARERLETQQKRLIDYVEKGGTWLVQHNTRFGKQSSQIGPYPFTITGGSRIAEETAVITILFKDHPLMSHPNKITENDFNGWIQERGLYFADDWDANLTPLLSGNDAGETPKDGGLLYAKYGKGIFIYSGYSWFRELPAGVPGAYRIFINLISAKGE